IAVDRGKANISDAVERAKTFHNKLADALALDFVIALAFELAHDSIHHPLDAFGIHGPFAQSDLDGTRELVAIEGYAAAGFFRDRQLAQLHAFEGRESAAAIRAGAAAADGGGVLARPRVLDLGFETAAVRAPHRGLASKQFHGRLWRQNLATSVDRET